MSQGLFHWVHILCKHGYFKSLTLVLGKLSDSLESCTRAIHVQCGRSGPTNSRKRSEAPGLSVTCSASLSLLVCWLRSGQLGREQRWQGDLGQGEAWLASPASPFQGWVGLHSLFDRQLSSLEQAWGTSKWENPFWTTPMVITVQRVARVWHL